MRGYYEKLYFKKLDNSDEIDKFLEKAQHTKIDTRIGKLSSLISIK